MKHLTRISLCIIFALACVASCMAQYVKPAPAKIKLKHKSRIGMMYDKFKDESTVIVGPYFLTSGMEYALTNSQFQMMAAFTFTGQKLEKPVDHVTLAFLSSSKEWTFLQDQDLYVLVDGERLSLGKAERDSDIKLGGVKEYLGVSLPYDTFLKIANGKNVEMKLGPKEFKLKDEHLEGFRDLASRMVP